LTVVKKKKKITSLIRSAAQQGLHIYTSWNEEIRQPTAAAATEIALPSRQQTLPFV
jgi:hypothetical protein